MNTKKITPRISVIIAIIFTGIIFRLLPHWPNFTPIAAMALFGGAYLGRKYMAFIVPIAALFLSDLIIGFHSYMITVYLGFAITVVIGFMLSKKINTRNVILASLSSSVIFFLITNFGAWLASPIYAMNFAGLMQSYVAGLAFFNDGSLGVSFFFNEVLGGLFYNTVFFGAFYFATKRFPVLQRI